MFEVTPGKGGKGRKGGGRRAIVALFRERRGEEGEKEGAHALGVLTCSWDQNLKKGEDEGGHFGWGKVGEGEGEGTSFCTTLSRP